MDAEEQKEGPEDDGPASVSRSSRREGGRVGRVVSEKESRLTKLRASNSRTLFTSCIRQKSPFFLPGRLLVEEGYVHRKLMMRVYVCVSRREDERGSQQRPVLPPRSNPPDLNSMPSLSHLHPLRPLASSTNTTKRRPTKKDESWKLQTKAKTHGNDTHFSFTLPSLLKQRSKAP